MNKRTKKFVLAGMLLTLGMVLPFLTLQIKEIGDSLLPMHLPVMLCGIFCGWKYGLICGLLLPFLRSICFGMPPVYPKCRLDGAGACKLWLRSGSPVQRCFQKTFLVYLSQLNKRNDFWSDYLGFVKVGIAWISWASIYLWNVPRARLC